MANEKRYVLTEVCETLGIEKGFVTHCIRSHWVRPADTSELHLDEQDMARLRLIHELIADFGVNHEAVPIILHLLDQLYTQRQSVEDFLKHSG